MNRNATVFFPALLIVLLVFSRTGQAAPVGDLRVSFLNVGQGDAVLLRDETNFDVLIDGGVPAAGPTVVAYLRQQVIDDIDVMVATHADSDHVGGLIDVLGMNDIPVQAVYYNGYPGSTATWSSFVTAVGQEGLSLVPLQYPGTLSWGTLTVSVLNPLTGLSNPEQNDSSVVLLIQHGSVKYLFTGDISSTTEGSIVARSTPVADELLKVAHHGSAYSSSASFLTAAHPSEAIISVGANSYGHPSADTIGRLQTAGARVWRTDQSGTIVITDNGSTYQMGMLSASSSLYLPLLVKSLPPTPTSIPMPPTSTPTSIPIPPTSTPTTTRTPIPPTSTPTTVATQPPSDGSPPNPWGYNFTCCNRIYYPPSNFCSYFPCISSFWNGVGYVVQCWDGMYSLSGGRQGVCSWHGGYARTLYAP